MDHLIRHVELKFRKNVPLFSPGDTVQVHQRIKEGERERVQIFEGLVIGRKGSSLQETVTVRKRSFGVYVEKIFPLHSPTVEQWRVVSRGEVRRAKLTYLRGKSGKAARIERSDWSAEDAAVPVVTSATQAAPAAPDTAPASAATE